jgi:hypothetical protein
MKFIFYALSVLLGIFLAHTNLGFLAKLGILFAVSLTFALITNWPL